MFGNGQAWHFVRYHCKALEFANDSDTVQRLAIYNAITAAAAVEAIQMQHQLLRQQVSG